MDEAEKQEHETEMQAYLTKKAEKEAFRKELAEKMDDDLMRPF